MPPSSTARPTPAPTTPGDLPHKAIIVPMRTLVVLLGLCGALPAADSVLPRVDAHAERFGAVAHQIWENPELGFHETASSALLQRELGANGFTVEAGVAGMPTAFTASYGSGKPVIVIMGEFDALPGLSQKAEPAQDPVPAGAPGHGCGHNLLGSASALAAVAIKEEMAAQAICRHPPLLRHARRRRRRRQDLHDPRRPVPRRGRRAGLASRRRQRGKPRIPCSPTTAAVSVSTASPRTPPPRPIAAAPRSMAP